MVFMLLILSCVNLSRAESLNITLTEWKYVSESIARTVRQNSLNIKNQEQCKDDWASSHSHQKQPCTTLPCTLGHGLAWIRPPLKLGAGRPGHISHWSPVQVKADRCRGACQVHDETKYNKRQMWMPSCKAARKVRRKIPIKIYWNNGTHIEEEPFCDFGTVSDHTECFCTECHSTKEACRRVPGQRRELWRISSNCIINNLQTWLLYWGLPKWKLCLRDLGIKRTTSKLLCWHC